MRVEPGAPSIGFGFDGWYTYRIDAVRVRARVYFSGGKIHDAEISCWRAETVVRARMGTLCAWENVRCRL